MTFDPWDTSFINRNLLNIYYVPGTMLGARDAMVN